VPFLLLGYGRLTCTLYLCPVFGEYYKELRHMKRFSGNEIVVLRVGHRREIYKRK
jgi:predicted PP-loop superfamily ATPase